MTKQRPTGKILIVVASPAYNLEFRVSGAGTKYASSIPEDPQSLSRDAFNNPAANIQLLTYMVVDFLDRSLETVA